MLHLDHQGHAQRTMFTQSTLSIPPFLRTHRCGTLKWRDPMQNNVFFFSGSPFLQFEHWPTWAIRGNYHPFLMEKIGLSWKSIYKKSMVLTIKHRGFQRILFPVLNLFRTASHLGHLAEACHWRFNKSWGFVRQYSGDQVHLGWAAGNLHVFKMVVYHHYHKNLPRREPCCFWLRWKSRYWSLKLESLGSPIQHLHVFPCNSIQSHLQILQKQQTTPWFLVMFEIFRGLFSFL